MKNKTILFHLNNLTRYSCSLNYRDRDEVWIDEDLDVKHGNYVKVTDIERLINIIKEESREQ